MSAFVIVDIGLKDRGDRQAFADYVEGTNRALADAGVKVIAFDAEPTLLEGEWRPRMIVVQEYPDMEAVRRFQDSDAYAPLKALRQRIADAKVVAVQGVSQALPENETQAPAR